MHSSLNPEHLLIVSIVSLLAIAAARQTAVNLMPRWLFYTTGLIGVAVHELSHAVACKLFGHKIHEICLFDPTEGKLGFVSHSWRPSSLYQRVGCLFIGIAPVIGGVFAIFLCQKIFVGSLSAVGWFISFSVAMHLTPSQSDLKGSWPGLIALMAIGFIASSITEMGISSIGSFVTNNIGFFNYISAELFLAALMVNLYAIFFWKLEGRQSQAK